MQIDSFTVLLLGIFIKTLLSALFLAFWLYDRRAIYFAWWGGAYACGALAVLIFVLSGFRGAMEAIGLGVALMIAAFSLVWEGARAFEGRRPLLIPVALLPAIWLGLCLEPSFLYSLRTRVVVSSLLIAPLVAMTGVELWRGRDEPLLSRWPAIVLFETFALLFVSRIAFIEIMPFPFGALPEEPFWVAFFNLLAFFHVLLLSVLMVSLSKERLELDQRVKAQTDPLTGALNRRAFIARGGRLLARHEHEKKPLCLMFLDLDHFKSLNDRHGHAAGDDVLMNFVAIVQGCIRPTDFVFRYGGEEFCCLLPHTSAEQAHRVAERIRHKFEMASVEVAGVALKTTVSLGIASTEIFGYDLDTLIRRADSAVYAAKRAGRNCVAMATLNGTAGARPLAGEDPLGAT
jgi:diguanylate cyclase (GGDEF)-like protein